MSRIIEIFAAWVDLRRLRTLFDASLICVILATCRAAEQAAQWPGNPLSSSLVVHLLPSGEVINPAASTG
jgi:hypothetical protein